MPKKIIISVIVLVMAVLFLITLHSPEDGERIIARTRFMMGTVVEIKVREVKGQDKSSEEAIEAAFAEIDRIEGVFSTFKDDSEISKINRTRPGEAVKVSDEMFDLIERSVIFSKKTNGAFDITVKPLVDAWKKAEAENRILTDDELKLAMAGVGSANLILDRDKKTVTFAKEGMGIDMGGIAKGYATGQAVKVLKAMGIDNAIVNSGGAMYCLGKRSKKIPWRVGVRHPRAKDKMLLEMDLIDMAVNTSGDYERYFLVNGKRYSHIIDPRSGYPIGDGIVSASVIAKDSTTSDILATALCILGKEVLGLVRSIDGSDAIMVFNDNGVLKTEMTPGIRGRYDITEEK